MSATIEHGRVARETSPARRSGGATPGARRRVPLPPLIALGGMAAVGLLALMPEKPDQAATPIAQRTLQVLTSADESLAFRNLADGSIVARVPGTGQSFVRGVFHSLSALRRVHGVRPEVPYVLAELSDGRVLLVDKSTSTKIDLEGFGPGNASKFTALLGLPPLKAPE